MVSYLSRTLAWIGERGPYALVVSILVGMLVPALSAYMRPFLEEAVFALLVLAFLRVEPLEILRQIRRPKLILLATGWQMIAIPALLALAVTFLLPQDLPYDIRLILVIISVGPSLMSVPAFMFILGLDGVMGLLILIVCMLAAPLLTPLTAELILGAEVAFDSLDLAKNLFLMMGGSLATALVLQKLLGHARIKEWGKQLDALNVFILLIFAIIAMDGVAVSFGERPAYTFGILSLTYVTAFTQMIVTMLVFAPTGKRNAFLIAYSAGNRNMGVLVAALGANIPEVTWLWFALGQIPIYTLPMLFRPVVRRYILKET